MKNETENNHYKVIAKSDRNLLQSASGITKCVRYYNVWQTVIAKCVRCYKVWQAVIRKCVRCYKLYWHHLALSWNLVFTDKFFVKRYPEKFEFSWFYSNKKYYFWKVLNLKSLILNLKSIYKPLFLHCRQRPLPSKVKSSNKRKFHLVHRLWA